MDSIAMEKLIAAVTAKIMEALDSSGEKKILVVGGDTQIAETLSQNFIVDCKDSAVSAADYDYVLMPACALGALPKSPAQSCNMAVGSDTLDFCGKKLIHERELLENCSSSTVNLKIDKRAIITALAADLIKRRKINVIRAE